MSCESDGAAFSSIAILLEVEALKNFILFLLGPFGFNLNCRVFFTIVCYSKIVADDGAVRVLEDREVSLRWLIDIAIIFAGGYYSGGVELLGKHDGYVDGVGLDLLDRHHLEFILSRSRKECEEEESEYKCYFTHGC